MFKTFLKSNCEGVHFLVKTSQTSCFEPEVINPPNLVN